MDARQLPRRTISVLRTSFLEIEACNSIADFINGDLVCGRQPWKSVVHDVRKRETRSNRVKRIVEGDHTDYAEWPWQVQMLYKVKSRFFQICPIKNIYVKNNLV